MPCRLLITDNVYRSNPVKKLLPVSKNSGNPLLFPWIYPDSMDGMIFLSRFLSMNI